MSVVEIYTDGACRGNPGPGGWGALLSCGEHEKELSGAEVHQRCGLASGTLYPILLRLEAAGWFVSRWESIDPSIAGRPRRRLYRLTPTGLKRASEVFASFSRGVLA